MRLEPVEKPRGLFTRLAYTMSRRRLGKTIAPLRIVYARVPGAMRMGYEMGKTVEKGLTLDPELRLLIQDLVASINGCGFCLDIGQALAVQSGISLDRFSEIQGFEESDAFTPREKAALAYASEATRSKHVPDDTFARLREHFSDTEIAEITVINAIENYFNLINLPLEIESDGLCAIALEKR